LTVMVDLEGSGKSSTFMPFAKRYSVMPSTEVTFSGGGNLAAFAVAAVKVGARRVRLSAAMTPARRGTRWRKGAAPV
jgi:hypothetical protein